MSKFITVTLLGSHKLKRLVNVDRIAWIDVPYPGANNPNNAQCYIHLTGDDFFGVAESRELVEEMINA